MNFSNGIICLAIIFFGVACNKTSLSQVGVLDKLHNKISKIERFVSLLPVSKGIASKKKI